MNQGIWIEDDYLERECYETAIIYEWITKYGGVGKLGHLIYYHTLTVL